MDNKLLLAFVGMPGSGKSEATVYLEKKKIPRVRFGQLTEDKLKERNVPVTPENEQLVREELRKVYGMSVYAESAEGTIRQLFTTHDIVVIDGLYSWEEYLFLVQQFPQLVVICVYCEASIRHSRLMQRATRSMTIEQAKQRDKDEIEKLNKGGPIAIADYLVENNTTVDELQNKLYQLLKRLGVNL